jgi:hypothetical protein
VIVFIGLSLNVSNSYPVGPTESYKPAFLRYLLPFGLPLTYLYHNLPIFWRTFVGEQHQQKAKALELLLLLGYANPDDALI